MTEPIALIAAALAGRYAVRRELGVGEMAMVYRAADLRHERQVAVKVLRQELATARRWPPSRHGPDMSPRISCAPPLGRLSSASAGRHGADCPDSLADSGPDKYLNSAFLEGSGRRCAARRSAISRYWKATNRPPRLSADRPSTP